MDDPGGGGMWWRGEEGGDLIRELSRKEGPRESRDPLYLLLRPNSPPIDLEKTYQANGSLRSSAHAGNQEGNHHNRLSRTFLSFPAFWFCFGTNQAKRCYGAWK